MPRTIIRGSPRADRCHRKCPEDATREIIELANKLFVGHALPCEKISESMKGDLEPTVFAIMRDRVTISPEYGHIGNFR